MESDSTSGLASFRDTQWMYNVVYQGLRLFRFSLVIAILITCVAVLALFLASKIAQPFLATISTVFFGIAIGTSVISWIGVLMWGAVPDWNTRGRWAAFVLLEAGGNVIPIFSGGYIGSAFVIFCHLAAMYFLLAYFLRIGQLLNSKHLVKSVRWLLSFLLFVFILVIVSSVLVICWDYLSLFDGFDREMIVVPAAFAVVLLILQMIPVVNLTISELRDQFARVSSTPVSDDTKTI